MVEQKQTVGFLGMGIMGVAMARNLVKSGQFASVHVWNRTLSKVGRAPARPPLAPALICPGRRPASPLLAAAAPGPGW